MPLFNANRFRFATLILYCSIWFIAAIPPSRAATPPDLIPVGTFFQNARLTQVTPSPGGTAVAMLYALPAGRVQLAVMELQTMVPKVIGGFSDSDVGRFRWVNDNRLVYDVTDRQAAQGEVRDGPGLFAVNRDGSGFRRLVPLNTSMVVNHSVVELLPWNTFLNSVIAGEETDDVFVIHPHFKINHDFDALDLQRLDTRTGRVTNVDRPGKSRSWLIDQKGVPRITVTADGSQETVFHRAANNLPWQQIATFDAYGGEGFRPFAFGPDGSFYVVKKNKDHDKDALYLYDLEKNAVADQPIVTLAGYDFTGSLIFDHQKLLGVRYDTDAESTTWFDPRMKLVQKMVDEKLPGAVNHISVGWKSGSPYVIVESYSDVQPDIFYLYNTETQLLTTLGRARPEIDPTRMGTRDMVRYKARDGLEIPAWLTLPKGGAQKNLPMVVLVHGGPWVRGGHWDWNGTSQFLASRGYAVLEPEFRGSTGFGQKHFRAGWKQWGPGMQNDVADGTRWAISQKIADPKRICIAGSSYGGYATLMGLINDPELYRCGFEWVGVTDIDLMYSIQWSDSSDDWKRYGMPRLVGDREQDAAQLKATSPIERAGEVKQPLLLAYGGSDRRVPIAHGTRFRDAVSRTNHQVEWVEYPDEGHGWALIKNRVDFWTRVESFLDRNIGNH